MNLTIEEFIKEYKPILNPFYDNSGDHIADYMFETYGKELDFVFSHSKNQIWTETDSSGFDSISNGIWKFNRVGYFVTEIPFEDDDNILVILDDGSEDEEEEEEEES